MATTRRHLGKGWAAILERATSDLAALPGAPVPHATIDSFGILVRFTTRPSGARADVKQILRKHEASALRTCERCGAPGAVRSGSVITVKCDRCAL